MNVNITSVKFKADKKLHDFITEKIEKLTSTYNGVIGSNVILKLDNSEDSRNKVTEIRLMVSGYDIFAKKKCKTFEEATDTAVEALRKQLKKHKEKIRSN